MLSHSQRENLRGFVQRSPEGTGFLQRAHIILLADEGKSQEEIASVLEMPIVRVRQFLRAFNRQGTDLFPEHVLAPQQIFSPDSQMVEAAREIMKDLLGEVSGVEADLVQTASITAVHESRKKMRSLRTALRLFSSYFEEGSLDAYRKRFRKAMRGLAGARDYAVFVAKLGDYIVEAEESERYEPAEIDGLRDLQTHWQDRLDQENRRIDHKLAKGKYEQLLAEFDAFLEAEILPKEESGKWPRPKKTRHLIPILISQKVARVRAFDDALESPSPELMHRLRIQVKNLRYTIEFFEPVLGPSAKDALAVLKDLLTRLGDLNDARVALTLLDEPQPDDLSSAVSHYKGYVASEIGRLTGFVLREWELFDSSTWRQSLSRSIVTL